MPQPLTCALIILTSLLVTSGCGEQSSESPAAPTADTTASAPPATKALTGTVMETIDAASYTYVRVDTGNGEIWAAAPRVELEIGQEVVVPPGMPMENFHSDTLDRDFELVYFVNGIGTPGTVPAHAQMPPGHPEIGSAKPTSQMDVSGIEPAKDGFTIAALYDSKSDLAGESVTLRAKVVKVNLGIMGRNWLHIQDGTGHATAGSNDLTVTTDDTAKVGDTVTVTGTVTLDKDFGAGYRYALILEGAEVTVDQETAPH